MIVIVLDNTKGKGDNGILKYVAYSPVNTKGLVWYSYLNRLWCSPSLMADLYIPSIIFFLAGNDLTEIVRLILRFHIIIFAFLFIRVVYIYLKKKKVTWFIFRLGSILILTILPLIRLERVSFNPAVVLDTLCLLLILSSFLTSNKLIANILKFQNSKYSKIWIKLVDILAGILFIPLFKSRTFYKKLLFKKALRNKKVVDQYLYVVFFILLAANLTSFIIDRTEFEMMKSLSFLLPLAYFNRIIIKGTLVEGMQLNYLPISEKKSRALTDGFSIIGAFFIWGVSVILFSVSYQFHVDDIVKGLILFLAYFPLCLLFTVKRPEKWHSEEQKKKLESKSTKTSFIFFLILLPFSMFMEWLIQISLILAIITAVAVSIFYYYSTYAKPKLSSYDKFTGNVIQD
ncbi:hypothetical protein [Bacillus weihaiensis]|uniref:hypothetical protein n=1 Tax=Bacillus weihaiensis TaxID=1547283 RepID=UPI0023532809|nr:hypothetical protein [Bacillus weihaiensis]